MQFGSSTNPVSFSLFPITITTLLFVSQVNSGFLGWLSSENCLQKAPVPASVDELKAGWLVHGFIRITLGSWLDDLLVGTRLRWAVRWVSWLSFESVRWWIRRYVCLVCYITVDQRYINRLGMGLLWAAGVRNERRTLGTTLKRTSISFIPHSSSTSKHLPTSPSTWRRRKRKIVLATPTDQPVDKSYRLTPATRAKITTKTPRCHNGNETRPSRDFERS